MPAPGLPSVMSFCICLYLAFPVTSFYFLQGDRGVHDMFVPGFPCVMSFY